MSNLGKDWKDELADEELQSLQYEVSLNGVHEEIRHTSGYKPQFHKTTAFAATIPEVEDNGPG